MVERTKICRGAVLGSGRKGSGGEPARRQNPHSRYVTGGSAGKRTRARLAHHFSASSVLENAENNAAQPRRVRRTLTGPVWAPWHNRALCTSAFDSRYLLYAVDSVKRQDSHNARCVPGPVPGCQGAAMRPQPAQGPLPRQQTNGRRDDRVAAAALLMRRHAWARSLVTCCEHGSPEGLSGSRQSRHNAWWHGYE